MKRWRDLLRIASVATLLAAIIVGGPALATADDPPKDGTAPGVAAPAATAQTAAIPPPPKPDPGGIATGGIGDITAKVAGKPTLEEVAETVGHNKISINIMWTLVAGFLVMFMQAGFALAETGLTRAKNAAHTMMMNMMVYGLGMTGYWIMGFALQMGGVGAVGALSGGTANLANEFTITLFGKEFGLFGMTGFFLSGVSYDAAIFALFLFQMVFMDTAATIPTGAMAERWKFSSFVVFAFFISMITYPLYANWVWGGGWLATLGKNFGLGHGHVDFAGSSVVHMVGGVTALAGAWVLGARLGKYNKDGSANALPAHNIPMALTGCFHPGLRLVRLQRRQHAGGNRPADRRRGHQHHARFRVRRHRRHVLHVGEIRQARSEHGDERSPGRPRGDHGALRICEQCLGVPHRRRGRRPRVPERLLRGADAKG